MNDSKISVRYSKALFLSALDKNLLENVNRDMNFISELCKIDEIKELLDSQIIRPDIKFNTLKTILKGKVEDITLSLVQLAVRNGREKYLPSIARAFRSDTLKHKGVTECTLTSAVKLKEEIKKEVVDFISTHYKTKVNLVEIVDEDIIGGFILKIDDNYIDASIKSKLRKIKKELTGRNITV
ncbi:MAG: ATP synthase F1 subunit delta [Bacteroidales bacterium]|nr:ATP synthase F1 subunit delta [Bacteroidales bacterium]